MKASTPGIDAEGWLSQAHRRNSPNYNERPPGCEVELLVVHGISLPPGEFGGPAIDALFLNRLDPDGHPSFSAIADLRVSAHLLIRRNGELWQYVSLFKSAWHAGHSVFAGREACNDFSLGVELEGTDLLPYSRAQYQRLAEVIGLCRQHWPILEQNRIVGHSDIAPGRKTDPGPAFDWKHLHALLERRDTTLSELSGKAAFPPG